MYAQFLADTLRFELISLTDHLISSASNLLLVGTFGMRVRTADAIQLASALWWFERVSALNIEPGAFIVADTPLRDAAAALGLVVDNPEDHE